MPEEIEVRLLLDAIYLRYHYDFRSYAPASIKRRLTAAKLQMHAESLSALQERVLREPQVFSRLLQFLTVGVSDMFRDPSFFRAFREQVVPELRTYPSIRVWIAGCSTGEELYSLRFCCAKRACSNEPPCTRPISTQKPCAKPNRGCIRSNACKPSPKTTSSRAASARFRSITRQPTGLRPSTAACEKMWYFPITAWRPTACSRRYSSCLVAMC